MTTVDITAVRPNPALLTLPWALPLAEWPADLTVFMPRGISRNVVRFVRLATPVGGMGAAPTDFADPTSDVVAIKELPEWIAAKEYRLLGELVKLQLPVALPVAAVSGRHTTAGEPLPGAVLTAYVRFSLPYRALLAADPDPATADRLIDALVVLLVRLHLAGFMWGDCSLSNTLFRRDAGQFEAYLVDAETGELHETLSRGQRAWDVELATEKCTGELLDLAAGGLFDHGDPIELGLSIADRYATLWQLVTGELRIDAGELWRLDERIRALHDAGFDAGEVTMRTSPQPGGGQQVVIRPQVVEAGFNSRRLLRLTGLDTGENQARRLLSDIDAYRVSRLPADTDELSAARAWLTGQYQPLVAAVPPELRGRLEPPEVYHEVLEHRWYLCQREARDVSWDEAVARYVAEVLAHKPDEELLTDVTTPLYPGEDDPPGNPG